MSFSSRQIQIESAARLHLGFVDLNGDLGRRFGSLGLAISDLSTTVVAQRCAGFEILGDDAQPTEKIVTTVLDAFDLPRELSVTVTNGIPTHAGLGSGTQLSLAVAAAIAEVFDLNADIRDLARLTGRGQRSGIGIGVFEEGGFVADGGLASKTSVPPLLARFEFPCAWRVILISDRTQQGLNGASETAVFESIQPMSRSVAAELCRLTLMGVFPALVEQDFSAFSTHIAAVQQIIGDHFAPFQGGQFTSPLVAEAVKWLSRRHAVIGVGQTSWGPTGFAFVEEPAQAVEICNALAEKFAASPNLGFSVHQGRNSGATIEQLPPKANSVTVG